jgi:hypothetical protein
VVAAVAIKARCRGLLSSASPWTNSALMSFCCCRYSPRLIGVPFQRLCANSSWAATASPSREVSVMAASSWVAAVR